LITRIVDRHDKGKAIVLPAEIMND